MASWEHPPSWSWWRTLQVAGASPRLLQTLSDSGNRAPVRDLQGLLVLWTGPSWTSGPSSSLFQTLWPGTFTCGLLKVSLQAGSWLLTDTGPPAGSVASSSPSLLDCLPTPPHVECLPGEAAPLHHPRATTRGQSLGENTEVAQKQACRRRRSRMCSGSPQ